MNANLTARQKLEYRGARLYLVMFSFLYFLTISFTIASKLSPREIMPTFTVQLVVEILAIYVFLRKRRGLPTNIAPWVIGAITMLIPMAAKLTYVTSKNWTFAVQSYNTSILLTIYVVMLYLFYRKNLFRVYAALAFIFWTVFLFAAWKNGAEFYLDTIIDGKIVNGGIVVTREIFFVIVSALIAMIAYKNIPIINQYDTEAEEQRAVIELKSQQQREVAGEVKQMVALLFEKVAVLNDLAITFNDEMHSQAASFEEMAASLEELLGSAENISTGAADQLEGNTKMEEIVTEFRHIQQETKKNLNTTLEDIENIASSSREATEQLAAVEGTVNSIKDQSGRIKDTISIIVDIADKINLLSLNASIEAARAGEAGRGFAVVADEIGKLAYQTQEGIKDIQQVLVQSAKNTQQGVGVIQNTALMVKTMIDRVSDSSEKIKLLQESILIEEKYIAVIIEQMYSNIQLARAIGRGTDEQKKAIEASNRAIEGMNEVLGVMVDEVHQIAESAEVIHSSAKELQDKTRQDS